MTAVGSRQIDPSQDTSPFPHEPIGLGTLRDVREERFYQGGTLTVLTTNGLPPSSPLIYDPYPDYESGEFRDAFTGRFRRCRGPSGQNLDRRSPRDMVSVYPGVPRNFPLPLIGSYEAMGLDAWVCTDRVSRLSPYGYNDEHLTRRRPGGREMLSWDNINWKRLELECLERNSGRFSSNVGLSEPMLTFPISASMPPHPDRPQFSTQGKQPRSRSAIILRAWHTMEWTENLKQHIRSLIMETSLHTGAEYEVFILLHVKDKQVPLYASDDDAVRKLREKYVPREFLDMTIMFNDDTLAGWYPKIEEHSPVLQYWQASQILSQLRPDFDYFWQLEMDARLTVNNFHFFERAEDFARQQPRKYLWERNSFLYIPGTHGTWESFTRLVNTAMEGRTSVWGAQFPPGITPTGPKPPVDDPRNDEYEWGVGEEADFLTFLPIFDPSSTEWPFVDTTWNINVQDLPRRASPVVMGRISKRLITLMHEALADKGIGLASEMTAPSFALWHGLKVVHVPHPIYLDGKWTPKELGRILNPGTPEKINGGSDSIWSWNHQWDHIIYRMSYMFTTQTAEDLFRRWLGYKIDPNQYTDGSYHQDPQGRNWFDGGDLVSSSRQADHLCIYLLTFPLLLSHDREKTYMEICAFLPCYCTRSKMSIPKKVQAWQSQSDLFKITHPKVLQRIIPSPHVAA
ncbi:DUF3405 domain-containing protein [Aspergillus aculeatinus CBS 121060]|uniref:Uncharacterized protein n=1 Tax=Aspergillus aculeatinus CBS 121060 TaxID=1448322 RepID=A0ACD1H2R0_9EURO|nr:hypothetical protein BO66DRAFT_328264 [Aspergillus aculeatinus CBS 121060]RAH67834.1 hypothetical protein BO66DRAFT_328264 [Aspergillus aculeatinus CBS 121060]